MWPIGPLLLFELGEFAAFSRLVTEKEKKKILTPKKTRQATSRISFSSSSEDMELMCGQFCFMQQVEGLI